MNTKTLYQLFQKTGKVCTDTRQMEDGCLFFALSGENFNGNRFAPQALEKGAVAVIVDDPEVVPPDNDPRYILVENSLQALQELAQYHRCQFTLPVLAITGTNGKTTTKELCAAVLASEKNICATQGNFNNHIGVPLTLLNINKQTEVAIVEMGANHPGEIAALCQMAQPTHGLITNIGKAHLEGFGDFDGVIKTKNELYQWIKSKDGLVFVHRNNPLLMELSGQIRRITYGTPPADVAGILKQNQTSIVVEWEKYGEIKTRLYGSYNFANVMAAIAVGNYFGVKNNNIRQAIEKYEPKNNRSQWVFSSHNQIILDAYNANPESMALAIDDFVGHHFPHPLLILGDMFELGKAEEAEHLKIVEKLKNTGIDDIILTGKAFYKAGAGTPWKRFKTTEEAIRFLQSHPVKNRHILVKGSRGMALESLIQYL
ncbi:UDP-N-acetylmuramoyl-tripeptide--D-alanyl-D-alanine ligase [Candidatus Sulfidibacterium hydrothermale]|uniref:UDP-N-acetylmuramoyl-tripeptide--D-alanyl-D- alanine ligase n=1 Tax=Candidatus Sulfidibacterium hydrothermale TaxID=2875962 RepID=UPI001F0A70A5|nr:UDP-N-acetylmuramoyl-tripeptide--D-alanyl-D-alanine ligase [Candidatus Sulfidibacterium hydrothermale]UBM62012.1 UDP-N-acetylmuramoyl-tripeptide--D-alanyl-D-alanine ligase [Candidatus Sulfidibacterium hydrothermale]